MFGSDQIEETTYKFLVSQCVSHALSLPPLTDQGIDQLGGGGKRLELVPLYDYIITRCDFVAYGQGMQKTLQRFFML
jgi:hypothetical protein